MYRNRRNPYLSPPNLRSRSPARRRLLPPPRPSRDNSRLLSGLGYANLASFATLTLGTIAATIYASRMGVNTIPEIITTPETTSTNTNMLSYVTSLVGVVVAGIRLNYELSNVPTTLTVPPGVANIQNAPYRGSLVTSVTIPEGVTSIGPHAFEGYRNLTSVTIPVGVTSIGYGAFKNCSSLTSVTIPDSVRFIGDHAFGGCSSLTSVTIPDGVTSIGESAFEGCSSLTSVIIPDGVTSIRWYTFKGCTSLTSIIIPDTVRFIWPGAFKGCCRLTNVQMPERFSGLRQAIIQTALANIDTGVEILNAGLCDVSVTTGGEYMQDFMNTVQDPSNILSFEVVPQIYPLMQPPL